jgi:translocation and assembly module TamB
MPLDNQRDNSAAAPALRRGLRRFTRRHAVISGIVIAAGVIALILIGLLAYRLGFVDRYVAGQIKNTLATYGIRAEIRDFHTSLSPQTVEMLNLELYDAKTGEKLGKVDRLLATVRVEDLYALNLHRDINLQDLKVEGLELWVKFDAQGQSNFHNLHIPPPEPNSRILFAYSAAHFQLKNGIIHYGDALHNVSGDARNVQATMQPEDPNAPMGTRTGVFALTASNSTFVYDGRPVNNIDIEARGRINETLAEIQELTLRSPIAEAHLMGRMDDWRAFKYHFNVTSTVDLTQASDILQTGTTMRGAGNFVGTVTGDGDRFQVEGAIKSDALAADGVRLQGLNLTAKGSGQGKSYDISGRAVAELLTAGDFQLNAVQLTGGVMGTGSDFRWVGELRAAAEKSYGTTVTGLILRDARAEYRDGVLMASAPQFTGSSLTSSTAKVREGIQASDLRVKVEKDGTTTGTIASAKAGKIEAANTTVNGVTAKTIDIKSNGPVTNVNVKEVQVGEANAFGAQTGSINIAGVRLSIRNGRVEGSTNDINAGTVTLKDGQVENVKLARPVFTVEPSGRYRASADLSLGGGVLGQMKLGPAHAAVVATSDQIQINNFAAEAMDGNASGNATIALKRNGASRINANFNNFDLAGLITVLSGRVIPIASKATGQAELSFSGTDFATASGNVNAQLKGEIQVGSDLAPLSGDLALTANHGQFQIQRVNLQTAATRLTATGQFSIDEPTSNLRIDLASSDAAELQRLLINSGAIPEIEEQFRTYGIDLGGKLAFNGTLNGALKDPTVNGHAELGSLIMNGHDLGSLTASVSSTAIETRISDGRLTQANGGGARFAMVVPRAGKDNISIDATLDRMNAGNLIAALPKTDLRAQLGDTDADVSGTLKISGAPNQMSGVADLRSGPGRLGGEPLQNLTAHATFSGSTVNLDKVDVNFNAGHLVASGKFDMQTKVFDLTASGDRVQLDRLEAFAKRPTLPKVAGTAVIKELKASGVFTDVSTYQISFDASSTDMTVDGRSAGSVTLVGRTENKQLNITFTTTGLLGPQPQIVTAQVVLSNEKLPAVIESTITGADLTQVLAILLPQTDKVVMGRATGALKLSGNLLDEDGYFAWQGLTGNATFTELSVKVEEVTLSAAGPLVIDIAPNEVNFHETRFTGQDTNVTLRGAVATAAGGSNTLTVNGHVNLQLFSGVPSRDVFSSGEAELAINVSGTFEERRVTGTARLNAATISVLVGDQRLTLSNLAGVIRFAPVRQTTQVQAQIESLTGILGGGKVRASGGALLEGYSLSRFLFNVHGENVTVDYPQDFRSTVTADLELRGDKKDQFISGTVNVHRTEYTKDIELADLINRRPAPSIEEGGEFQFSQTANFDKLRVEGRNALIMRNNLGNLVASVSLQLNGPIKDPIIEGRITATRGTLNFRNNPYEITRGLIYFPPRLGADPVLNIEAQAVIRGYRLTALVEGPLSHPQTNVSAEPSLPQADVVSLMLTGTLSSTDSSTSVLAQSGLGTAASLLTDALISAPISRATNKLFGLSRLEISPVIAGTGSTPTARLTAARRISKDIVVTYSTNLASDRNQVLAVEYRVSNRLSFVAQYEQGSTRNLSTRSNNYGFEIRFRKRF